MLRGGARCPFGHHYEGDIGAINRYGYEMHDIMLMGDYLYVRMIHTLCTWCITGPIMGPK